MVLHILDTLKAILVCSIAAILLVATTEAQIMQEYVLIDWNPNGTMLSVASDSQVEVIDATTGTTLNSFTGL